MTALTQETSSKVVLPLLPVIGLPLQIGPTNITSGSTPHIGYGKYVSLSAEHGLFDNAYRIIRQIENPELAGRAKGLVETIRDAVATIQRHQLDLSRLPPLHAIQTGDGSFLLEWIFSDFRVGLTVERNPNDSGWYLVSNRQLGDINSSGYLTGVDAKKLLIWLLDFILSHS